jgi:hypothetical protein
VNMKKANQKDPIGRRSVLGVAAAALECRRPGFGNRVGPNQRAGRKRRGKPIQKQPRPGEQGAGSFESGLLSASDYRPGRPTADLVFLRSRTPAHPGRRMDPAGHEPGAPILAGHCRCHDAAHGRKLSGTSATSILIPVKLLDLNPGFETVTLYVAGISGVIV